MKLKVGRGSGADKVRLAIHSCLLCAQVPRIPPCSSKTLRLVLKLCFLAPLLESAPASPQNLPAPLACALPALRHDTTNRRKGGSKTHWVVEPRVETGP